MKGPRAHEGTVARGTEGGRSDGARAPHLEEGSLPGTLRQRGAEQGTS